jgi:hypothetical protein
MYNQYSLGLIFNNIICSVTEMCDIQSYALKVIYFVNHGAE